MLWVENLMARMLLRYEKDKEMMNYEIPKEMDFNELEKRAIYFINYGGTITGRWTPMQRRINQLNEMRRDEQGCILQHEANIQAIKEELESIFPARAPMKLQEHQKVGRRVAFCDIQVGEAFYNSQGNPCIKIRLDNDKHSSTPVLGYHQMKSHQVYRITGSRPHAKIYTVAQSSFSICAGNHEGE